MTKGKPGETTVLVLQGGGALGAYQGGAFEALAQAGRRPDWVAGISIGAINSALIAGNPPEQRTERLRAFWERVTANVPSPIWVSASGPMRTLASDWAAAWGATFGVPGFFEPRSAFAQWSGDSAQPSFYDTAPLRETLSSLVDFDYLNAGPVRMSVGAVDIETGNFVYFDNRLVPIGLDHIMASSALPPGFPAVQVDGHCYWDGGLVSNTPLRHVVENLGSTGATIFQVDLFNARGALPRTLAQVAEREKDIRYSSRTRAVTDMLRERNAMLGKIRAVVDLLPEALRADPEVEALLAEARTEPITLVHLIHRHKGYETQTKDYEFSGASMREHWGAGHRDMAHSLRSLAAARTTSCRDSFRVFDFDPLPARGASHP